MRYRRSMARRAYRTLTHYKNSTKRLLGALAMDINIHFDDELDKEILRYLVKIAHDSKVVLPICIKYLLMAQLKLIADAQKVANQ